MKGDRCLKRVFLYSVPEDCRRETGNNTHHDCCVLDDTCRTLSGLDSGLNLYQTQQPSLSPSRSCDKRVLGE